MGSVTKSQAYDSSATDLWARVGKFQAIHEWHPLVASVQPLDDGKRRECTLADGATLFESLVSEGDMSYTYRIDESPLPLSNYEATISVREEGTGSMMEWSATFEPDGIPDAKAEEIVNGIFQAGFDNL